MSKIIGVEDAKNSLKNCQDALQKHLDDVTADTAFEDNVLSDALKQRHEYFEWIRMKTKLIGIEKSFRLPCNALPNKISGYVYNYLYQDRKDVIDRHYKKDSNTGQFIICVKKNDVPIG